MYNNSTSYKSLLSGSILGLALLSTSIFAGPGKPGNNSIKPGGNIVEVALEANALLGEFDYLLGAVGCLTDAEGNNPVVKNPLFFRCSDRLATGRSFPQEFLCTDMPQSPSYS